MIGLSLEQRRRLVAPLEAYTAELSAVMAERRTILAALQAVAVPESLTELRSLMAEWVSANETTSELTANMAREHEACTRFLAECLGAVFTVRQKAAAMVTAFPAFPDVYALVSAACAELRPGAPLPAAALGSAHK